MTTVEIDGKNFTVFDGGGSGEPVVHVCGAESGYETTGSGTSSTEIPRLSKSEELARDYRLVSYSRQDAKIFLPGEGPANMPVTHPAARERVVEASEDCLSLMRHLGLGKAHIFAHRRVTVVGLDLAMRAPEVVATLAIYEPEMMTSSWLARKIFGRMQKQMQSPGSQARLQARVRSPEMQAKIQEMMFSPRYQEMLQKRQEELQNDDGLDTQADGDTSLLSEASRETDPARFQMQMYLTPLLGSSLDAVSQRVRQPVLSMLTSYSSDAAKRSDGLLKSLLPQTETYVVPKPSHWYRGREDIKDVAAGYAGFLGRYPIRSSS